MIPFGIFLGICSGGVVFMLYFLAGCWTHTRASRTGAECAVQIPARATTSLGYASPFPNFSPNHVSESVGNPSQECYVSRGWRVLANREKLPMKRAK